MISPTGKEFEPFRKVVKGFILTLAYAENSVVRKFPNDN